MLSLPTLTKNQDHHITHRLSTPSRGRFHFDTKSFPAFLENYALEDCLKCANLQVRVQVNADEDLDIHGARHVLTTLAGSKFPSYPSIMNSSEDSFTIHKSQNLKC